MFKIDGITDDTRQRFKLRIENSDTLAEMSLVWRDTQNSWFMDISWKTFEVKGMRICFLPNILTQFSHLIPFGIMITTENFQDPIMRDTFLNGTSSLYILNETEIKQVEASYG